MNPPVSTHDDPEGTAPPAGRSSHRRDDDAMVALLTRTLHDRAADAPDADVVAARIAARLDERKDGATVTTLVRRGTAVAAAGVVAGGLVVAGAGAAAAAAPYSQLARTVEDIAQTVGITWSAMPEGYTREQYEALWGSGYTWDDVQTLRDLWSTDETTTKARAGQMIIDGQALPLDPGGSAEAVTARALEAFWDAGYTIEDAEALADLWSTEMLETKTLAGQKLVDGETLPLGPTGP